MRRAAQVSLYAASIAMVVSTSFAGAQTVWPGASVVDQKLVANEGDGTDWPSYGRTYSENHFSPLTQVNEQTVGRLKLAWSQELSPMQRSDTQPLEAGGVIYATAGLSIVHAFEATTGKLLWTHDPNVAEVAGTKLRPSWGVRGLALWKGTVIVGTQDGRLIALNAKTGEQIWSTQTLDRDNEATITGAPRVFGDRVVIGYAGAERANIRGAVAAFDAATGKFLWRFYTVPGDPAKGFEDPAMEMAAKTWSGEWWKHGGGGTVWNGMTYDPELDRLYIGTGNGGPWNWKIRNPKGGDALFLASIVALDAKTGAYVWHHQQNPNEAWDYNSTMDIAMATIDIDGRPRKVLMQAPKSGFYFVLDRETGKLISAEKIGKVTWATGYDLNTGRPIEAPDIRYQNKPLLIWPGTFGVHNWQPMSYSPVAKLAFIPSIHQADAYAAEGIDPTTWKADPNNWNTGLGWSVVGSSSVHVPEEEFHSYLQAWDPGLQKRAWRVETPGIVNGGTMATAGGLVFQGHIDGTFNAFAAATGKKLWSFPAGVSVLGAPISFSVGGKQYITVMAGPPSGSPAAILPQQSQFGWRYRDHPRRLLTFVLDGTGKLPATAAPGPEKPLVSDELIPDPKLAKTGATSFNKNCMTCHGVGAVASGAAPDLRASPLVLSRESFAMIVRTGALKSAGMPDFPEIGDAELDALRHYVRQQARGPSRIGPKPSGM
ncbi:PQQ-dependent dehydrogenase, methanol/ethanol family [Sphingobium nicotianae]|uniref:PQQ-dependent dehydrogenase, methanol/ethanol family n=1 Tax=Sphingobium nicotianae TaxID=2782607 RepID=A0A9X1IPU1_9SPHN|nr:PQQ-dependent dehydrogenase, methanol/ethanol family [Sphingobium nicotianae]